MLLRYNLQISIILWRFIDCVSRLLLVSLANERLLLLKNEKQDGKTKE